MKQKNLKEIVKFFLVGTLNTVIDYGLFFVLFALLGANKNFAQTVASLVAMTNSYLINRYWTFEKAGSIRGREIWRFAFVNLLSLGVTLLCLNLFYDVLSLHEAANRMLFSLGARYMLAGDVAVLFCKVLSMPFSMAVNFLGNKLWVFAGAEEKNEA